jgi:hypothetical protein
VPTLPSSMRRSSLVSRGLNGTTVGVDATRMVTHAIDEVRAAVAAMGSAADVEQSNEKDGLEHHSRLVLLLASSRSSPTGAERDL